jgi:hypothetical protein
MNESFGELKARVRALEAQLTSERGFLLGHLEFAEALNKVRRLLRDGDRSRKPTAGMLAAVERAELLGRTVRVTG